jgi:hypothetical protein
VPPRVRTSPGSGSCASDPRITPPPQVGGEPRKIIETTKPLCRATSIHETEDPKGTRRPVQDLGGLNPVVTSATGGFFRPSSEPRPRGLQRRWSRDRARPFRHTELRRCSRLRPDARIPVRDEGSIFAFGRSRKSGFSGPRWGGGNGHSAPRTCLDPTRTRLRAGRARRIRCQSRAVARTEPEDLDPKPGWPGRRPG